MKLQSKALSARLMRAGLMAVTYLVVRALLHLVVGTGSVWNPASLLPENYSVMMMLAIFAFLIPFRRGMLRQ